MCTWIIDYRFNFFILDVIIVIVDLMHVRILKEHLCSWTMTWLLYWHSTRSYNPGQNC